MTSSSRSRVAAIIESIMTLRIQTKFGRLGRETQAGIFPYVLRDLTACASDHIWGIDITYIRLRDGWMYLVAVLDWYFRYIASLRVSSLDVRNTHGMLIR